MLAGKSLIAITIVFAITSAHIPDVLRPNVKDARTYFTCFPDTPNKVAVYSKTPLTCPRNTFCNKDYVILRREFLPRPCITVASLCPYECGRTVGSVIVNNVELSCPANYQCNEQKSTCEMCIQGKCDPNAFECLSDSQVKLPSGVIFECPVDKVCNINHIFPCAECILPPPLMLNNQSKNLMTN